jgi:hypothetical protein
VIKKFNIEFVNHMGYYIPKTDVEGFYPDIYFKAPMLDERGLCGDKRCQQLGYCRNKVKRKAKAKGKPLINPNQIEFPFQ